MKAGQRREREIAHARTDIVDAAINAFARAGLHATTMQDIAREAGYTAASLYTYFKSKQEIVEAMLTSLTDEYLQVYEEPVPSGLTFRQRFELVLRRHLELVERRRAVYTLLDDHTHGSLCGDRDDVPSFHDNFQKRIHRLATWLKDNAQPDDLGGKDPDVIAAVLFGMGFGLMHFAQNGKSGSFVDFAPLIVDFFFHGVSGKPKTGARKK